MNFSSGTTCFSLLSAECFVLHLKLKIVHRIDILTEKNLIFQVHESTQNSIFCGCHGFIDDDRPEYGALPKSLYVVLWRMHLEASPPNSVQFSAEHGTTVELRYFGH